MSIRILVNGYRGKMGQETVVAIEQSDDCLLVGSAGKEDDLLQVIADSRPDVVVDFTTAHVAIDNAQTIINAGVRPVIGTTGFSEEQIVLLQSLCQAKCLGGIIAPNFSIAALLMMKYAEDAVGYLPEVEIIEYHHPNKKDAPSGTALRTAQRIAAQRVIPGKKTPDTTKNLVEGSRGGSYQGIPLHAIRLPGVLANQTVLFGGEGERLSITHETLSRRCFMPGVLLACRKVMSLDYLVYGLEHILDSHIT